MPFHASPSPPARRADVALSSGHTLNPYALSYGTGGVLWTTVYNMGCPHLAVPTLGRVILTFFSSDDKDIENVLSSGSYIISSIRARHPRYMVKVARSLLHTLDPYYITQAVASSI